MNNPNSDANNDSNDNSNDNNNNNNRQTKRKQRGPQTPVEKLGRALGWALRHKAKEIGLTMTNDGYVPVQEILTSSHPRFQGATLEAIQEAVDTDNKQRFKLKHLPYDSVYNTINNTKSDGEDNNNNDTNNNNGETNMILCIRANQGHTLQTLDSNLLFTKLTPNQLLSLPCIVHGTYQTPWKQIQKQGLSIMERTHIHFAKGLPNDNGDDNNNGSSNNNNNNKNSKVISGMRSTCTIYIFINPQACIQDGIEFFESDNGVILTSGINGILPTKYFSHVMKSTTGKILLDQRSTNEHNR